MKVRFKTIELEHLYTTPLDELKGKLAFPKEIIKQFKRKIEILISIASLFELKRFRSLNFKSLKGDRLGEYSVRLNKQYRLIFTVSEESDGDVVLDVAIISEISKHYEK